jgi:D-amino-acid dehydrogenase
LSNLFLNTGHGTLGWTMACGSAQVLADQLMGVQPAISTEGLDMGRYAGPWRPSAGVRHLAGSPT